MTQLQILILWTLLPYVLFITPAVVVTVLRARHQVAPWFYALFLFPFLVWSALALLSNRPSSLANLALEPRLLAGVINICFVPEIAAWKGPPLSRLKIVVAIFACALFAAWLGIQFPEMLE